MEVNEIAFLATVVHPRERGEHYGLVASVLIIEITLNDFGVAF